VGLETGDDDVRLMRDDAYHVLASARVTIAAP
jgi:hypothetical protein